MINFTLTISPQSSTGCQSEKITAVPRTGHNSGSVCSIHLDPFSISVEAEESVQSYPLPRVPTGTSAGYRFAAPPSPVGANWIAAILSPVLDKYCNVFCFTLDLEGQTETLTSTFSHIYL